MIFLQTQHAIMVSQNLPSQPARSASCGMKGMIYSEYGHHILENCKGRPLSLVAIPTLNTASQTFIIIYWLSTMACLNTLSFRNLLPSWVKHLLDIMSDLDQPYTNTECKTSSQEVSHQVPVNSGYVTEIIVLPDPPPAYLISAVH